MMTEKRAQKFHTDDVHVSALVTQASFYEGSSGDFAKHQLFSQVIIITTCSNNQMMRIKKVITKDQIS